MLSGKSNGFRDEFPADAFAFMDLTYFGMIDDHFVIACHAIDHESGRRSGIADKEAAAFFRMYVLDVHIFNMKFMIFSSYLLTGDAGSRGDAGNGINFEWYGGQAIKPFHFYFVEALSLLIITTKKRKMNVSKVIPVLMLSALGFAGCTKHVTQVVNQAFSAIYTVRAASWTTTDAGLSYSTTLNVPEIDDILLKNGAVIVYLSFDGGTTYEALPESFGGVAYGAIHQSKTVYIDLSAADGTATTVTAPTKDILAKVVLVDAQPLD